MKLIAKTSDKSKNCIDVNALQLSPEFKNLSRFFEKKENFDLAETILKKKKKISLRIVEFVTANSKRFFFNIEMHGVFRDKLDSLGKRDFDIFRRSCRFDVELGNKSFTTNLSQMRFFQHAIRAGVIQWLLDSEDNVKKAEKEMAKEVEKKALRKKGSRKKRKRELKAVGASNVTFHF